MGKVNVNSRWLRVHAVLVQSSTYFGDRVLVSVAKCRVSEREREQRAESREQRAEEQ
eukprot:SAG31_NODE_42969_length_269_cov_0.611765_1_plen_56_part_10